MSNNQHESKNGRAKNRKNRKAVKKEAKIAKQTTKEMGKSIFDNLSLAEKNARKNNEITKPLVKTDWSVDEKFEEKVKKISIDLENIQVLKKTYKLNCYIKTYYYCTVN